MHNKSWIADNRLAIVGGRNIGDEYFAASEDVNFIDLDVAMIGPVVRDASASFDRFWNSPTAYPIELLDPKIVSAAAVTRFRQQLHAHAEEAKHGRYAQSLRSDEAIQRMLGGEWPMQWARQFEFVSDDPRKVTMSKREVGKHHVGAALAAMIETAQARVTIISPYFVPGAHFAETLHSAGLRLALASSSKNADAMLSQLTLPNGQTLLSLFDADLCGAEVPRGKPDPSIFLSAADALGVPPEQCVVVEDAPAGVRAALAGEMRAIGIARLGDEALLRAAGANVVVTSLDEVDAAALVGGALRSRPVVDGRRMYDALQPTKDPGWFIRHDGYNVMTESVIESRFALSNGFLGMRAARSVSRGPTWLSWLGYLRWASWPRCYVAGLFDIPNTEPPVPALVPLPDWSRVRIILDGEVLSGRVGEVLRGIRQLDMRRGLLTSTWVHRTSSGITVTGRELRLLSQADRSAGLQLLQLSLDRDAVDVKLEASFAMAGLGMEPMRMDQDHGAWRTEGSGKWTGD